MQHEPHTEEGREVDVSTGTSRRMDQAVRAALRRRPAERRSFGNEDDLEGPRVGERSPPSR